VAKDERFTCIKPKTTELMMHAHRMPFRLAPMRASKPFKMRPRTMNSSRKPMPRQSATDRNACHGQSNTRIISPKATVE